VAKVRQPPLILFGPLERSRLVRKALIRPEEDEPGRRSAAKLLTKNEARRIVVNIAKLSESSKSDEERAERSPRSQKWVS
jgi:hypothetical protein